MKEDVGDVCKWLFRSAFSYETGFTTETDPSTLLVTQTGSDVDAYTSQSESDLRHNITMTSQEPLSDWGVCKHRHVGRPVYYVQSFPFVGQRARAWPWR